MATKNKTMLQQVKSKKPTPLDSMTNDEFNSIMENGLSQAKSDQSRPVDDVFADLRRKLK